MTINFKINLFLALLTGCFLLSSISARAEEAATTEPPVVNKTLSEGKAETMDLPAISHAATGDEDMDVTHPIMRLTQDKSEMVKLDHPASSVIVGNPNNISVLLDTPDTLVVVPRTAGASHFTVIGKDGSILMQRHVIVGGPQEQYIRIRRSCAADDRTCQPTSVYFCPDMCHEVSENTQTNGQRRR